MPRADAHALIPAAALIATIASCASPPTDRDPIGAVRPEPVRTPEPSPTTVAPLAPPTAHRVETPTGLVYEVLREGTGDPCEPGSTVRIRFRATLADGTEFDSTDRRKQDLEFDLASAGLINGLREGITGMRTGEQRRLFIPWELAYGEQGRDPIPPKADLIFDLELVSWQASMTRSY